MYANGRGISTFAGAAHTGYRVPADMRRFLPNNQPDLGCLFVW